MLRNVIGAVCTALAVSMACGGSTTADAFGSGSGSSADGGGVNDSGGGRADGPTGGGKEGGGGGSYDTSCNGPGDCELGAPGCCGVGCGEPSVESYVGIKRGTRSALFSATCSESNPACPDCASQENPNIQAFCRGKTCQAVDVRKDEVSKCQNHDECLLRPAACCPCGVVDIADLVGVAKSRDSDYRKQVCDPAASCTGCDWKYDGARPRCEDGHCVIERL